MHCPPRLSFQRGERRPHDCYLCLAGREPYDAQMCSGHTDTSCVQQTRHSMTWSQSPPHEMHIHLFFSFFGGGDLVELAMLIIINGNCDETRWSMYSMPTFLSKFCFLVIGLKICCIYHKKGWVSKLHPSFGGNKNMFVTLSTKAG